MVQKGSRDCRKTTVVGLIIFTLGVIFCLASLIFNWLTMNDGNGANIGAGLVFLVSIMLILGGLGTCLIGFFIKH